MMATAHTTTAASITTLCNSSNRRLSAVDVCEEAMHGERLKQRRERVAAAAKALAVHINSRCREKRPPVNAVPLLCKHRAVALSSTLLLSILVLITLLLLLLLLLSSRRCKHAMYRVRLPAGTGHCVHTRSSCRIWQELWRGSEAC